MVFACGEVADDGETFVVDRDDLDDNEVKEGDEEEGSVESGDLNKVEMEEAAEDDIEGETLGTRRSSPPSPVDKVGNAVACDVEVA